MGNLSSLLAFTFGPTEIMIVAAVGLLLFGNRLPSVMRSMGRGVSEFRDALSGVNHEVEDALK